MLLSKLELPVAVELPNSDAFRVIRDEFARDRYIAEHGDVVVNYDFKFRVYRVPPFAAGILKYTEQKLEDCRVWGCE